MGNAFPPKHVIFSRVFGKRVPHNSLVLARIYLSATVVRVETHYAVLTHCTHCGRLRGMIA